jgi:hypothetical protein
MQPNIINRKQLHDELESPYPVAVKDSAPALHQLSEQELSELNRPVVLDPKTISRAQRGSQLVKEAGSNILDATHHMGKMTLGKAISATGRFFTEDPRNNPKVAKARSLLTIGLTGISGIACLKNFVEFISSIFSHGDKLPALWKGLEFGAFAFLTKTLYQTLNGSKNAFKSMNGLTAAVLAALGFRTMNNLYGKEVNTSFIDKLTGGWLSEKTKSFMDFFKHPLETIFESGVTAVETFIPH